MLALATLTGPVPRIGVVAVAALAAIVLVSGETGEFRGVRIRAAAMLAALVLAPVLLLADIWHSSQLGFVHRHPLYAVVGAVIALAVLAAVAVLMHRRPQLFPLLAVLTLPFRIPISTGGNTSNLLLPLYFVTAAGALAWLVPALIGGADPAASRDPREPAPPREPTSPREPLLKWVDRLLALYVVLYALQAIYSTSKGSPSGFEVALQNMVFFYVPFALLYRLLRTVRWTPQLLRGCLAIAVVLGLVFSVIGFVEYATKTIILNSKLVAANDVHTYFTVNSVFFDPDIFGRYLALTMILLAVTLLYPFGRREQTVATGALAVLWACLVLTLSRSSLGALLVGMAILAALRWKPSRALVVAVAVIAIGAAVVALTPTTFGLNQGLNGASSGRGGLVSGGLHLFGDRPLQGWGSGSFVEEYRVHNRGAGQLSASHTIPITIGAEQGVIGLTPYVGLVVCALICLVRGARGDPARSALAAAFGALVFHTMLYADFLEDPTTWALLGIGLALASAAPRQPGQPRQALRPGSSSASAASV
ncbi:MAG TPA: O-antigen ligase family protein [Solirubrobacteraceae bacterium]|nr:O-antigen ligase family protein [Solirubrobacteraceae bacterium]